MTADESHQAQRITGIILCGGAGRRVAGADKPLMEYRGRPLIEWVLDALRPQVGRILISANRHADLYGAYAPVIADEISGFAGPLAGIVSCLKTCDTELAFVCPGDAPFLTGDTVGRLSASLCRSDAAVAVVHDGTRRQNLHLLLERNCIGSLVDYMDAGNRSVHGWLDWSTVLDVDFDRDAETFRSLNEADEFR